MAARLYRYIVRYDGGTAPNPFGGFCTLAICKPVIRRCARKGDWVLGFRSGDHSRLVYAMQVCEVLPLGKYWEDPRFLARRPPGTEMAHGGEIPTDNIYRPSPVGGGLVWVPNRVHDQGNVQRDTSGLNALVADRYWYFGAEAPIFPPDLAHLQPRTQGHAVHVRRQPHDEDVVVSWLETFESGVRGQPKDLPAYEQRA